MKTKTATKYYVSRQNYYYTGLRTVEIAQGGIERAGCDMLCSVYPGEGENYTDPREAVEAALKIAQEWAKTNGRKVRYSVVLGANLDMFEGELSSTRDLRKAACTLFEQAPKCDRCGELLVEAYHLYADSDLGDFCSEYCAEEEERELLADMEPDEDEDEDEDEDDEDEDTEFSV